MTAPRPKGLHGQVVAGVIYGRAKGSAWAFHPDGANHPDLLELRERLKQRGYRLVPAPADLAAFASPSTPPVALLLAQRCLAPREDVAA